MCALEDQKDAIKAVKKKKIKDDRREDNLSTHVKSIRPAVKLG